MGEFSPPMAQAFNEPGMVPEDVWRRRPWELQLDPRVRKVRLHTQPRVLGRIRSTVTAQREIVYGMNGPCPTPLRHPTDGKIADRLIRDPKGPGTGVRAFRFREYAWLKGVLHELHEHEPTPVELRALLQAVPVGAATFAFVAAQRARNLAHEQKAGVNYNPEEEQVQSQMRARAWREGRLLGRECEALQDESTPQGPGGDTRVGGYDSEDVPQGALRELVETLGLLDSDARDNEDSPRVGGPRGGNQGAYEAQLRAEGEALLMEALAEGTSKTYRAAWDQWMVYARVRGIDPFFDGQTRKEIRHDAGEILVYVVHLGITMSRAAGTVKAKLFALRQMHVMGGYPGPLQGKPRLWMALKGLERRRGPARRKLPKTPGMLKWIRTQLHPETCANDAVLWACLMLAFFFLVRVGEYAFSGHWDLKVLAPADLKGQAAGRPVTDYVPSR